MKKKYIAPEVCLIKTSTEGNLMRELSWATAKQGQFGYATEHFHIVDQAYEDKEHPGWVVAGKQGNSLWDDDEEDEE